MDQADHSIPLSAAGVEQSRAAGKKLKEYLEHVDAEKPCGTPIHRRMWVSPYRRARDTAKIILEETKDHITDMYFSVPIA